MAALAAIAFAAVAALVIVLVSSGSSLPSPPMLHSRSVGPIAIFQADQQVDADPLSAFKTLRRLGVERVRVFVPWGALPPRPAIAPDAGSRTPPAGFNAADPGAYTAPGLALYDAIDRAAAATGVGTYFVLGPPPPLWASGRHGGRPLPQWRPSARDFGQFVRMMGVRYSGNYVPPGATTPLPRVGFWGIWNEPNYGPDLAPQAVDGWSVEVSPALYRALLDSAWSALRASGHARDTILFGELAPRGVQASDGMTPLRFLRALYCVDGSFRPLAGTAARLRGCPPAGSGSHAFRTRHPALFEATGLAIHPYPQGLPPNDITPDEPGYADLPAIPRLERTLDNLQRAYGSARKLPIYDTEFGYKTDPPFPGGVSPSAAAAYINWAEYISWRDPRIRSYDQYLLTDPPCQALACFATGLEYQSGKRKPSFTAYRVPVFMPVTEMRPGQSLEVWGCVRPAHYTELQTGRVQQVQIQLRTAGSSRYVTIATVPLRNRNGYFDVDQVFKAPGTVRLRWRSSRGGAIFSRTVTLSAR